MLQYLCCYVAHHFFVAEPKPFQLTQNAPRKILLPESVSIVMCFVQRLKVAFVLDAHPIIQLNISKGALRLYTTFRWQVLCM